MRSKNNKIAMPHASFKISRARFVAYASVLLAFALGTPTLAWRHLWGDEAYSVWAAQQRVAALFGGIDTQPPLSYLVLKWQTALWGQSVFAVRFGSVWFGVLGVALMFCLARLMLGQRAAAGAVLLFALAPMHVYFMQEARMYTLALALCLVCMACTVRLWMARAPAFVWWVLAVASVGALYTHFYCAAILGANALTLLLPNARSRQLKLWLVTHGSVALVFGAWFLGVQWRVLSRSTAAGANPLPTLNEAGTFFMRGVNGLLFGMRAEAWLAPISVVLFLSVLFGVWLMWTRHKKFGVLTGLWLAGTLGIALATAKLVPDFSPRYFIFALLPVCLSLGLAWSKAQQPVSFVALGLLLIPALIGNAPLFQTNWQKSFYADAIGVIRTRGSAQTDGVVLQNSDQFVMYDYYGPTPLQTVLLSNEPTLKPQNETQFAQLIQNKNRVWLLNFGAATGWNTPFEQYLKQNGVRIYDQNFGDSSLALFDLAQDSAAAIVPRSDVFGEHIKLVGVRVRNPQLGAGDALALDLFWQTDAQLDTDYTVFVHVRRADTGQQIAANDSPPANGNAPTTRWVVGQIITDTRGVAIPLQAVAGEYDLVIGLYTYPSFEKLAVNNTPDFERVVAQILVR